MIGVDDNCNVIGIDQEIEKLNHNGVRDKYINIIRDLCKRAVKCDIDFETINGKEILIINIEEGRHKPYATRENGIYIRVNGSDRRPDPDVELPYLLQQRTNLADSPQY